MLLGAAGHVLIKHPRARGEELLDARGRRIERRVLWDILSEAAKLNIEIELSEHLFHAYECEATRRGKKIEELVEKLVNGLVRDMEKEIAGPPVYLA